MNINFLNSTQRARFPRKPLAAAVLLALATPFVANLAHANAGFGQNTDVAGNTINVPTFFASSPSGIHPAYDPVTQTFSTTVTVDTGKPLRKFVDSIGGAYNGLGNAAGATDLAAGIPVAMQEHNWFNPATGQQTKDDYLELAIVEYTEQMHSDLFKPTRLRGYVQIETAAQTGGAVDASGVLTSEHIKATYPDGSLITDPKRISTSNPTGQVYFVHKPHYLGPVIVATKGTPMRIKLTNYLPYTDANGTSVGSWNGTGGDLPIPVDETIPGGGPVLDGNGQQIFAKDLAGAVLKDSKGNPIPVKMGQNRSGIHWHGGDTPWISDGTPHQWIAPAGDISYTLGKDANHPFGMGKGDAAVGVPDMAAPGDGEYTFFFPNNLSGRMMFYHDHTYGLTRLNVYQGVAAGYVVIDTEEQKMVASALGTSTTAKVGNLATGLLDTIGVPLVFQDKGFVPKNVGPNAVASDGKTPQSQDAKWNQQHWGQEGDLFFPHVYETNQDPNSADGTNPVGRWDWGPWFWPVFPAQYSLPSGDYGDVTTTPESFMDTALVNGKVYPTMTVDPKAYRFRILNAANDRALNLNLYQAVDGRGRLCDVTTNRRPTAPARFPGDTTTNGPATCSEVKMVPAVPTAGFPANWPVDGRVGGVPDPATAGPDIVQIGSEGGLLPAPAVWKSQPTTYETDVRSITVFNVLHHGLLVAPAERADVLVDFSQYAGKTLIVYNDAPAPMPGFDPRIDYYTGMGDNTAAGGAYDVAPGYGPNTRTFMQIKVNATNTSGVGGNLDVAALANAIPAAYAATQPAPLIPAVAYNAPFGKSEINNYAAIGTGSGALDSGMFKYTENGTLKSLPVINKAIQELFDPVFGRMNATLAVELPFSTATVATTIPLSYIDHPEERLDAIKDGETQIWKITHNGVDDHPVHFHLVNVQVINRVGWDGVIKPPEANELGWKETLRMNPLEDVYLAVKATRPVVPFGLPTSSRLLDPSQALNSQLGFTQLDPTTGQAPNQPYANVVTDFDNEYVWHCHILGHEEFDFMRPFVFHPTVVTPDAPAAVSVTGLEVTWTDTTPYGGQDAQGIPTAGTNAAYPEVTSSPQNEIGFKVFSNGVQVGSALANVTKWTAPSTTVLGAVTVVAYNAAGSSAPGVASSGTTTTAGAITTTAGATTVTSTAAPTLSGPAGPTGLGVVAQVGNSATLSWTAVAGATGYTVNGVATACVPVNGICTATVTGLGADVTTNFLVSATTRNGATSATSIGLYNGKAFAPVGLTDASSPTINGLPNGSVSLTWANDKQNANNVTGLTLSWVGGTATFAPGSTGGTVVGLAKGQSYTFSLTANSVLGNSAPSSISVAAQ
jgi:FtsP/CotA-like multicopper oxidase with cupredoxin domain